MKAKPSRAIKTAGAQSKAGSRKYSSIKRGPSRYAVKDRKWRAKILALASWECAICGEEAVDAHHIAGKQAWPKLRYDIINGIALCRKHHDWARDSNEAFGAWLLLVDPAKLEHIERAQREQV